MGRVGRAVRALSIGVLMLTALGFLAACGDDETETDGVTCTDTEIANGFFISRQSHRVF